MADNKISVELELIDKMSERLERISTSVVDLEKQIKKSSESAGGAFEVFKGVLGAEAVKKGIEGLTDIASEMFKVFVVDGLKAASATAEALNQLNGALAINGNLAEGTSESMKAFAQALQQSSRFTDDQILSSASLIESLTQLDEAGLKTATQAAADLAARFNLDLGTAAQKVGLAIDGNTQALRKQGIAFEEGNTKAETFANAMEAINAAVGGSALQSTKTFAGAIDQIRKNFEDITKVVGEAIIQNGVVINVFSEVGKILGETAGEFEDSKQAIALFIGEGIVAAIDAFQAMLPVLAFVERVVRGLSVSFVQLGKELGVLAAATAQAASGDFAQAWDTIKTGSSEAAGAVADAFGRNSALESLEPTLQRVKTAADAGLAAVRAGAEGAVPALENQKKKFQEITGAQQELIDKGIELFNKTLEQDPSAKYEADLEALRTALQFQELTQQEFDEARIAAVTERDKKLRELQEKKASDIFALIESERTIDAEKNAALIDQQQKTLAALAANENTNAIVRANITKKLAEEQKKQEQDRVKAGTDALDQLATFQTSKTKELAAIGKAAAIAKATIDTYVGANAAATALAGIPIVGPVLAAAAAGAFIAAGAARVAAIVGTPLARGIDSVPGIGNQDNFPAVLAPGERVVPKTTNQDLTQFLRDQNGQTEILAGILGAVSNLNNQITVQVGSKEIVNELRDQLASGRVLA